MNYIMFYERDGDIYSEREVIALIRISFDI